MKGYSAPSLFVAIRLFLGLLILLGFDAHADELEESTNSPNFYEMSFDDAWRTPPELYVSNGVVVEGASTVGGYIVGIPGFVAGIPVGTVAAFVGQLAGQDMDQCFNYTLNATSNIFTRVGQTSLGLPVLGLKKIFLDYPLLAYDHVMDHWI